MATGDFADRICASKMLRAARGDVPLQDFASRLGVAPAKLERWETGAHFPAAMLTRALLASGVHRYLLDTRQLQAVGEFTEEVKSFFNNPDAQRRRVYQLIGGKARLLGWATAAALVMLFGAGLFTDAVPTGLARPTQAAAPPTTAPKAINSDPGVLVAAPAPTPIATAAPEPTVSPTPAPTAPPAPTPTPVVAAPQEPSATPVPTPVPTPVQGVVGEAVDGVAGGSDGSGGVVGTVTGSVGGLLGTTGSGDGS
jgi:hypothetical protein